MCHPRKRDYIVMSSLSSDRHMTAVHEYIHLLVRHSGVDLPPWLNEGFAMLYATLEPVGKKAQVGAFHPGYQQTLLDNKWLDIATLTSVDHDSPHYNEKKRAGVFYAESLALVHMLSLSERYPREEFPKLIGGLVGGNPADAAFQEIYGKSLEQVYKDLRAYMRRGRFFGILYDIKLAKAAEEPEVRRRHRSKRGSYRQTCCLRCAAGESRPSRSISTWPPSTPIAGKWKRG